ncbi:MAG: YkoF family thiamine/hydroxymethylpyrimidine-binding protein [bacterium]
MRVQAEVSLYPFGVEELLPPIKDFVDALRKEGLEVEMGPLSSYVAGESEALFSALGRAFEQATKRNRCVLIAKIAHLTPSFPGNPKKEEIADRH